MENTKEAIIEELHKILKPHFNTIESRVGNGRKFTILGQWDGTDFLDWDEEQITAFILGLRPLLSQKEEIENNNGTEKMIAILSGLRVIEGPNIPKDVIIVSKKLNLKQTLNN